jgi:hypothetical protein
MGYYVRFVWVPVDQVSASKTRGLQAGCMWAWVLSGPCHLPITRVVGMNRIWEAVRETRDKSRGNVIPLPGPGPTIRRGWAEGGHAA